MKTMLLLIGMVFVLEGLPWVANPEAMQRYARQITELPPEQLRILGAIAMLFGFLLCAVVQKTGWF